MNTRSPKKDYKSAVCYIPPFSAIEDIQKLRREIDLYDSRLSERPWRIVANKCDLPDADENLAQLRARFPNIETVGISAEHEENLRELRKKLEQWLFAGAPSDATGHVPQGARSSESDSP